MKIGDLVRKTTRNGHVLTGIIINSEQSGKWLRIVWGGSWGTYWEATNNCALEMISESGTNV